MPQIEVLQNASTAPAPGWAYVTDRAIDPSKIAINPSSITTSGLRKGKRAVRIAAATSTSASASGGGAGADGGGELTRREQVAVARRIADLDRDRDRGREIEIPKRWREWVWPGGSGRGRGKGSGGVRRILMSEKTFGHHLADEEALRALKVGEGGAGGHGNGRKIVIAAAGGGSTSAAAMLPPPAPIPLSTRGHGISSAMDISPPPNASDAMLLHIDLPTVPTAEDIEALLSAPALSYNEACAAPPKPPSQGGIPQQYFCELCGYWGRVRCLKCGSRVCGLKCKVKHDEDCRQRFA